MSAVVIYFPSWPNGMKHPTAAQDTRKGQYISNKRPSRFVILSETKDLARRTEILRFTQDDTPETASFDWQHVLFEMYCPLQVPWLRAGVPFGTPCSYAILLSC